MMELAIRPELLRDLPETTQRMLREYRVDAVLAKPFEMNKLLQTVAHVLDGKSEKTTIA